MLKFRLLLFLVIVSVMLSVNSTYIELTFLMTLIMALASKGLMRRKSAINLDTTDS